VRVEIPNPANPEGDPVFVYDAVKVHPGPIGFATVCLPRWPSQPIGYVARNTTHWSAYLLLPPTGRDEKQLDGRWPRRDEAVRAVVHAYHWRFPRRKVSWEWERAHRPLHIDQDAVPGRWDKTVSYQEWTRRRSDLHRFLALNRWLFDKPTEIRPAAPVDTEETP